MTWTKFLVFSCGLWFIMLIGSLPVMSPYLELGLRFTIFYFFIFIVLFPLTGPIERLVYDAYNFIVSELEEFLSLYFHFDK
jgi:hypothetical protein